MISRRSTLKLLATSAVAPVVAETSFALAPDRPQTATSQFCPSCGEVGPATSRTLGVLGSIATLKYVSLPPVLRIAERSDTFGLNVQYVDSLRGNLAFYVNDLQLDCNPILSFRRIYDSESKEDSGLGRGWTLEFDDSISLSQNDATLHLGTGLSLALQRDTDGATLRVLHAGQYKVASFVIRDDSTIIETNKDCVRAYTRISGKYYLSNVTRTPTEQILINRDDAGRIQTLSTASRDAAISFSWSASEKPRLLAIADKTGRQVRYRYAESQLSEVTDVTGSTWLYSYRDGLLTEVHDPEHSAVLQADFVEGRVSRVSSIYGTASFRYVNEANRRRTIIQNNGAGLDLIHNEAGQVTHASTPGGSEAAELTYDDSGSLTTMKPSDGPLQRFTYDDAGRMIKVERNGTWASFTYDEAGRIRSEVLPGGTTTFSRDDAGDILKAVSTERGRSFSASYDDGNLASLTSWRRSLKIKYDDSGQMTLLVDPQLGRYRYGRDEHGWLSSQGLPDGYTIQINRNERGQVLSTASSDGVRVTYDRDLRGALIRVTTSNGEWVTASRNDLGLITGLANSRGQTRGFKYDEDSRLVQFHDARGRLFNVRASVSGGASKLVQENGSIVVTLGPAGEDLLETGGLYDDGWFDDVSSHGLLGSFSDDLMSSVIQPDLSYGARPVIFVPRRRSRPLTSRIPSDVTHPPQIVYAAYNVRALRDQYYPEEGNPRLLRVCSQKCSQCVSTQQANCQSVWTTCEKTASAVQLTAIILCTFTVESGPGYLLCVAGAIAVGKRMSDQCNAGRTQCLGLVESECDYVCHA